MVSPVKGVGMWLEIKTCYQNSEGTLHELAERFGVGKKAVEMRCYREGWKREMKEVCRMVKEKVAEQSASEATKWVQDSIRRAYRYRADIDASREQGGMAPDGRALMDSDVMLQYAGVELKMDEMARRSLGLSEKVEVTQQLGDSFISAISKLRADPSTPVLSSEDVSRVIDAPQID